MREVDDREARAEDLERDRRRVEERARCIVHLLVGLVADERGGFAAEGEQQLRLRSPQEVGQTRDVPGHLTRELHERLRRRACLDPERTPERGLGLAEVVCHRASLRLPCVREEVRHHVERQHRRAIEPERLEKACVEVLRGRGHPELERRALDANGQVHHAVADCRPSDRPRGVHPEDRDGRAERASGIGAPHGLVVGQGAACLGKQ